MSSPSPSDPSEPSLPGPAPVATALAVTLVAIHLWSAVVLVGLGETDLWTALIGERSQRARILVGGDYRLLVEPQPWRLASSVWLHVSGTHVLVNALGLWVLGRLVEPEAGGARLLGIFAIGGLAGSVASHVVGIIQSDGASAGLSAWLGAAVWWGLRDRSLSDEARALWRGPVAWVTGANLVLSMGIPGVDATAHTTGTVAGVILAMLLPRRVPRALPIAVFVGFAAVSAAGLAGLLGSPFVLSSLPPSR